MAARCETVLNTTMAEMDTYHTQKAEDFRTIMTEHLDGEIAVYEQVPSRVLFHSTCKQVYLIKVHLTPHILRRSFAG